MVKWSSLCCLFSLHVGQGLFPNVEILKISSQGVEKTTKGEALTVITSDKSDETLVGDVPELDKESTVQDGFPSKFPSTMEVDLVDRMQLLLYTYGVRQHHFAFFELFPTFITPFTITILIDSNSIRIWDDDNRILTLIP